MLRRFAVTNYKNFEGRAELDFTNVRNYGFHTQYIRDGLVNKCLIVGRNGCGKTNLGLALFDIVCTLTDRGFDTRQKDRASFLNGDSDDASATFSYEFQYGGGTVTYEYRKTDPETIVYERMDVDGDTVFVRDGADGDYSGLSAYGSGNLRVDIGDGPLSVLRYIVNNSVQPEGSPMTYVMDFANRMLYFRSVNDGNSYVGLTKGSETIEKYIVDNGLIEDFQGFLGEMAGLDIRLSNVRVPGMQDIFVQETRNRNLTFDSVASSGTKALLLLYYWMKHFDGVVFLYMDEFDAYYHYELAEKVLRRISDLEGIQTVFTTHNTSLVSNRILRPDCYLRMDGCDIRSLPDLTDREIREGHNLEKLLRGGEFDE